jgi:hypothetical protein
MDFMEQWQAISARIRGLSSAAELHASFLKVRDSDSFGRGKYLSEQCSEVFSAIEMFVNTFRASLPPAAVTAIDSFINARRSLFKEAVQGPDTHDERNRAVLIFLPTLEHRSRFFCVTISPRYGLGRSWRFPICSGLSPPIQMSGRNGKLPMTKGRRGARDLVQFICSRTGFTRSKLPARRPEPILSIRML